MEKQKTILTVGGKDYTIVSEDAVEHVKRVGIYVDRKLSEIEKATKLPTNMAAVLTALNIADELLKAHDENTKLRRELLAAQKEKAQKGTK
jgi:Uncharacterized protein conserved in bacteria